MKKLDFFLFLQYFDYILKLFWWCGIFLFLAHLTQRVRWSIVTTERPSSVFCPSIRPLTFHILINSSEAIGPIWTKLYWKGPWMAPFQKCPVIPTSNQDGCQAKNRKKGGWHFNCLLLIYRSKWAQNVTAGTWHGVVQHIFLFF